jgi:glycosyltransferase involved in cell wall biosynthesis
VSRSGRIGILFLAPFGELGGSELMLARLVGALDERFAPRALVMTRGPLPERLRAAGVATDVEHLPGKQAVARFPLVTRRYAARLRDEPISVIHANGTKAALLGALLGRRLGARLLWMKHDHVFDGRVTRALAARCDRVVCVSEAMAAQFPPPLRERVRVAYPGVRIPERVEGIGGDPLVVSVGRLDPGKGAVELLRAVALLRERGLEARATVAGPVDRVYPQHADELRALVSELSLDDQAHVGWVDDLDELYRRARVVALASRARPGGAPSEGAPIVLMEAMGHGRPVVAPREPGIAEVVGDCGTLVDDRTPEAFARALEPYLADPRLAAEVGGRGRERAQHLFGFDRTVATLTHEYLDLAA